MNRTEYLKKCQMVSMYRYDKYKIRGNIPTELLVKFNEIAYYPIEYTLGFNNGIMQHRAILMDLNTNSIIHAKLENVEKNI